MGLVGDSTVGTSDQTWKDISDLVIELQQSGECYHQFTQKGKISDIGAIAKLTSLFTNHYRYAALIFFY